MQITVAKQPDGVAYMTKDGHGELFVRDHLAVGKSVKFGDNTVELAEVGAGVVCRFSWVDYLNTSNREVPGDGVRHTVERSAPGSFAAGPYSVFVDG